VTILVADDHETNRKLLRVLLSAEGHDVREARDGGEVLAELRAATQPLVALIDWQMPVMPGIEVCREARKSANANLLFLILLTVRDHPRDVVDGLRAGANDYITKPFNNEELLARVRIGARIVELQDSLSRRVRELEEALAHIGQLQGMLPICSYCKKIRDDKNYWQQVETYISDHSGATFSHGICPGCFEKHVRPNLESLGMSAPEVTRISRLQAKPECANGI